MNELTIKKETKSISSKVTELEITSQVSYETMADHVKDLKFFRGKIESFCKPNIDAAMETKRAAEAGRRTAIEQQDTLLAPVLSVEKIGQNKMLKYEDQKKEEERVRKEEADRKARELTKEAEAAVFSGDDEKADELLDEAENEELKSDQMKGSTIKKVVGCGIRRNYAARVVDITKVPQAFLVVDMIKLNAHARDMKEKFCVPGCEVYVKEI